MKKTCLILLFAFALCACKHTQPETHVSDIFVNAQYGENHAMSEWAGRHWELFGNEYTPDFEALTLGLSIDGFDSILTIICNDYGQPTYNHNTLPQELIPDTDTGTFWMAWKSYNQFYYWCSDTMNIGFGLFEKELVNAKGYAWLYIENLQNSKANVCFELSNNIFREGDLSYSKWAGYRWLFIPQQNETEGYREEYMLVNGHDSDLSKIIQILTASLGSPFAVHKTLPDQLYRYTEDISIFALPNNREIEESERLYWWETKSHIVRLYESYSFDEVGLPANAVISLYNRSRLK